MQKYKIADVVLNMDPQYPTLKKQSEAYRYFGDEEALYDLIITPEMIEERKEKYHTDSEDLIEYIASSGIFYIMLLALGGMMLHSSAVVLDGRAYLFSAPSGTGKSTHTSLWLKKFGDRARILNDDKPALRVENGKTFVYGTPWSGKTDLNLNEKIPLQGICFLERGERNTIHSINSAEAVRLVLDQTIRPANADAMDAMLSCVDKVVQNNKFFRMQCNMNIDAVNTSYSAMKQEEI